MSRHQHWGNTPSAQQQALFKPRETWLCLRFTHLALNSIGVCANSKQATVINDSQQVWQCNVSASQSAIFPGMSVNHALMLNPDLHLHQRTPQQEAGKLRELSHWAYRFTSMVSVSGDNALLLEIGKSANLFNGLRQLVNLIKNDLSSFRIDTAFGVAKTPKAAHVLSFYKQNDSELFNSQQLQCAALEHLNVDNHTIEALQHCGFSTLADIKTIPKVELGARFGQGFVHYLDQLWGMTPDPQIATTPPETFHAHIDFAEPICNLTWIHQQLNRLLSDLEKFIALRQLVCHGFTWRFYHENNRLLKTINIGLSAQQNTLRIFRELSDLTLANTQLDWEFSSIELSATQLIPKQLFNDDLFEPTSNQEQLSQLLDKLNSRLGHTALVRVYSESEHLPELANGQQPATTPAAKITLPAESPTQQRKDQPLWLLENPQRLSQQQQQLPMLSGPLSLIHGPNRISSHWWSKLQSRDYFIARQRNGRLVWVFFDRNQREWFLHGLFA